MKVGISLGKFSNQVIKLAQETEQKYGVPASVTLAQYALESGYGSSYLARTKNNYFGMRNGSKGWQEFASMEESFDAHGKLLAEKRYASKTANAKTVTEYVNGIAETYAPSSDGNNNYAGNLLKIIEENDLTQYDSGGYSGVTSTTTTEKSGFVGDGILSAVIQGVTVIAVVILAVVFFMAAFDIQVPTKKNIAETVIKKAVEK